ncbi:hypothetical protein GC102_23690 [Paenibacillus sp. LMG 31460]|uniref:Uncharacterized protein n=1 Tax=Paenibacillus germinis TaxID=2654979 RepID=A0ABX1ZA62_9BACL|nr:hypothetical protein [Paenibacillus germinis]NOU88730.1 hypothetical protein [Paenibacillus germinis]
MDILTKWYKTLNSAKLIAAMIPLLLIYPFQQNISFMVSYYVINGLTKEELSLIRELMARTTGVYS